MKNGKNNKAPKEILYTLLFFGAVIICFLLLVNYPAQRSAMDLDANIAETKQNLEEQKLLLPIYAELMAKTKPRQTASRPTPAKAGLTPDQIDKISTLIKGVAGRSGIETTSVVPDPRSLAGGSNLLLVNVAARGDFPSFREFLLDLDALPWLDRLEEILVQDVSGYKEYKLKMKLVVKKQ